MSSILNWNEKEVYKDSDKSGKITETFVYNQLAPQVDFGKECITIPLA